MSRPVHSEATASVPEAVTELFAQLGVRFSFDPAGPGFFYRETRDGDEHVSVARLSMGGEFSTWGDTEVFGVVRVRGARYDWSTSDDQGSGLGQPVLFRPGHPALVVARALEATNVYLTAAVLQEVADTVYGLEDTPVAFASSRPASPDLGRYWSGLVAWAADAAAAALLAEPLVRTDLTRRLAVGMLECFPLTGDRETRSLSMAAQSRRYRIAVAFLDDNAQLPITVEDAARAANTTTTALVQAFRANHPLGLTPAQYLRRVRLAGAHEDLLQADPTSGDTVRAIAIRWGFPHPGRFAGAYRTVYGVTPRWTLER
ncbi:helix-turn-helix domain-containing protein [Kocuria sp. NPDC057446]|uniref:helix-turn-helix domain-containing protein n=1 Tax=Kocuria sp. NPDC057446 TaxID=3346137 RepID=UPI00369740DC